MEGSLIKWGTETKEQKKKKKTCKEEKVIMREGERMELLRNCAFRSEMGEGGWRCFATVLFDQRWEREGGWRSSLPHLFKKIKEAYDVC